MNLAPIIRQLSLADFEKLRSAATTSRERFCLNMARYNRDFEYHIDLPKEQGSETRDQGSKKALVDMATWLADEKRFPNG